MTDQLNPQEPDDRVPDTSAAARIDRFGRGILLALLAVIAVQVLAIGPSQAVERITSGIDRVLP